jgi:hypothetical protein
LDARARQDVEDGRFRPLKRASNMPSVGGAGRFGRNDLLRSSARGGGGWESGRRSVQAADAIVANLL